MQKQENLFFEGHRSTFWIKMPFGIEHPPPTHQLQSTCVGEGSRVPNLQMEFNYLDSFKSYGIFSDFVVLTWSPSSSRHPHIVPIVPTLSLSSLSSSHCPHSPQKVLMWSPWSVVSVVSSCCPRRPCVISVVPTLSPHHLEGLHIITNPQIPIPPTPNPLGVGGHKSVKMQ